MFNNQTAFTMPVAPVGYATNAGFGGYGNGMFGGDGWWALIIILALFGGFGRGGFGNFGGYGAGEVVQPCATQADVRAAVDQQTLISKLDQQTYGLSDATFALNNTIVNGFHGVDNAICDLGYNLQSAINGVNVNAMQNTNAIQSTLNNMAAQNAACCCETQRQIERGFADTNYNLATQSCETRQAIADSTRSIIDFLTQDKIATLQAENQNLRLQASQVAQNQYLVNELRPCARPAYITCSPFQSAYGFYGNNNNCGCGCGCG